MTDDEYAADPRYEQVECGSRVDPPDFKPCQRLVWVNINHRRSDRRCEKHCAKRYPDLLAATNQVERQRQAIARMATDDSNR